MGRMQLRPSRAVPGPRIVQGESLSVAAAEEQQPLPGGVEHNRMAITRGWSGGGLNLLPVLPVEGPGVSVGPKGGVVAAEEHAPLRWREIGHRGVGAQIGT